MKKKRKGAAKKANRGRKPGGGGGGASDKIEIDLLAKGGASPKEPPLTPGKNYRVRWTNKAELGLTLTFTYWPFVEPPGPIQVEAHKKTKFFHTRPGLLSFAYRYTIDPDLTSSPSPPDPPGLVVGP